MTALFPVHARAFAALGTAGLLAAGCLGDADELEPVGDATEQELVANQPDTVSPTRDLPRFLAAAHRPHGSAMAGDLGFAWANQPTAASYAPSAAYRFNGGGNGVTITRDGVGRYSVVFAGLGGDGTPGGHLQVTAYGSGQEYCQVRSWSSSGADLSARVYCFDAAGNPADTRYTAHALAPATDARGIGYVWAGRPTTASYVPSAWYSHNGAGGDIEVARESQGHYRVRFAGLGDAYGGIAQATAYASTARRCKIRRTSRSGDDYLAYVDCYDGSGAASDARFNLYVVRPDTSARAVGYAWNHRITTASYSPSYQANGGGGAVTIERTGTGSYQAVFPGLGGDGRAVGNVQVTGWGASSHHCKVASWSSYGADFTARVRCFRQDGTLVDAPFNVHVIGDPELLPRDTRRVYRVFHFSRVLSDRPVRVTTTRASLVVPSAGDLGTLTRVRYERGGVLLRTPAGVVEDTWFYDPDLGASKQLVYGDGRVAGTYAVTADGKIAGAFDLDGDAVVDLLDVVDDDLDEIIMVAEDSRMLRILGEVWSGTDFACALRDEGFDVGMPGFDNLCDSARSSGGSGIDSGSSGGGTAGVLDQLSASCQESLAAGRPERPGMGATSGDDPVDVNRLLERGPVTRFLSTLGNELLKNATQEAVAGFFGVPALAAIYSAFDEVNAEEIDEGRAFVAIMGLFPALNGASGLTLAIASGLEAAAPDFANDAQKSLWQFEKAAQGICGEGNVECEGVRANPEVVAEACGQASPVPLISCGGGDAPDSGGSTDPVVGEQDYATWEEIQYERCRRRAEVLGAWGLVPDSPIEQTCDDPRVQDIAASGDAPITLEWFCSSAQSGSDRPSTDIDDIIGGHDDCGWISEPGPDGECLDNPWDDYGGADYGIGLGVIVGIDACDPVICDPFGDLGLFANLPTYEFPNLSF